MSRIATPNKNTIFTFLVCGKSRTKFIDILVKGSLGTFKGVYNPVGCDLDLVLCL